MARVRGTVTNADRPGRKGRARPITLPWVLAAGLILIVGTALLVVRLPQATVSAPARAASAPSITAAGDRVNRSGVAKWAVANATWGGWNPLFVGNDCTDFVSRALHFGGGLSEIAPAPGQQTNHDNNRSYWYLDERVQLSSRVVGSTIRPTYSKTWSEAPWSFDYQQARGGKVVSRSAVQVGDIAYVNLSGFSQKGIDHAGIVTRVTATNIYVAQQSTPNSFVPVFDTPVQASWQSVYPKMTPFFVDPSAER
ncbi:MAG: hypothetical protein QOI14_486 [Actinomycetota bacterium]|nr:hypothetical protein [Actinomycetota bacterium]